MTTWTIDFRRRAGRRFRKWTNVGLEWTVRAEATAALRDWQAAWPDCEVRMKETPR